MSRNDTIGTHKTCVFTDQGGTIKVVYHTTCIALREASGRITLNSGGWKTVTTKRRMNQTLRVWGTGYYVFQKKFKWFIGWHDGAGNHKTICEFYDGVTVQ
jgi:hypothetical protein